MDDAKLKLNKNGTGVFYIPGGQEKEERVAKMIIGISGNDLTVYHTGVLPKVEGKGLAKKLLDAMVDYVRKNNLKVIALCPYVYAQFLNHPDEYNDIWTNKKN
jgi:uncharacterized protein